MNRNYFHQRLSLVTMCMVTRVYISYFCNQLTEPLGSTNVAVYLMTTGFSLPGESLGDGPVRLFKIILIQPNIELFDKIKSPK